MDTTDKVIITAVVSVIITITLAITLGNQATNQKILAMVEAGANPVDAACALTNTHTSCVLAGREGGSK